MYHTGNTNDKVYQYDLSIPWDITSAIFNSIFVLVSQDTIPTALAFTPDGKTMYVEGADTDFIYQYNLPDPWDLSTAELTTQTFDTSTFDNSI